MDHLETVINILKTLRIHAVFDEYVLQTQIADKLAQANIRFRKEYPLGPRNRVDFLLDGGIAIEVKKGKPNRAQVYRQLERYLNFDDIKAIILVVETKLILPKEINGKPCYRIGLSKQWGIAL